MIDVDGTSADDTSAAVPPMWHHQEQAVQFIEEHDGKAMLYYGLGTGKTRCAIEWCDRQEFHRVLVLTPKAVIEHWRDDAEQFSSRPLRIAALSSGTMAKKLKEVAWATASNHEPAFVIVNYESAAAKAMKPVLLALGFDALVVDESSKMRAPFGKYSKWVGLKLAPLIPNRILLTGTPFPNSPLDIYGQMRILDPSIFGWSYARFRDQYAIRGGYEGHEVIGFQNLDSLKEKMRSVTIHAASDAVLSLPDRIPPVRVSFELNADEREVYGKVEYEFEAEVLDGTITVSNALVKLLRLQQLTGGHAHIETDEGSVCRAVGTSKQEALFSLLEESRGDESRGDASPCNPSLSDSSPRDPDGEPAGAPAVVFFRFVAEMNAVRDEAIRRGYSPRVLRGGVNELADWQSGGGDLMLVQIQSGSMGITLVRASVCIFYSLGFSLADYIQAEGRLHRPGQTRSVRYFHLVARGTVDSKVYAAIKRKEKIVESVLSGVRDEN